MTDETVSSISTFFNENTDGEFTVPPPTHPFSIILPTRTTHPILYTTKLTCLSNPLHECTNVPFGVIALGGIPNIHQLEWLQKICHNRIVAFLGDCDPVDLLIYLWLCSHINVKFIGVNDSLIADFNVDLSDSLTIPLAESETRAVSLLDQLCPDIHSIIGSECGALIAFGRKLELEAVINYARIDSNGIIAALSALCR